MLPQRPYVPHHRQNYFDQFNPEGPITFPKTTGGDGITLMDAMNENFDSLIGRDDPMFASYVGPAISLRLEVNFISTFHKRARLIQLLRFLVAGLQVLDQTDQDERVEEGPEADNQSEVSVRGRQESSRFHAGTLMTAFCSLSSD